jgi:predicted nucleic acid-binding protein
MIVIADTGPVNYLICIGQIEVLPKLFSRVLVPPSVCDELKRARAPEAVRLWIRQPPAWLETRAPAKRATQSSCKRALVPANAMLFFWRRNWVPTY